MDQTKVSVNCVQVYPCAYWKGLIRRAENCVGSTTTGFEKGIWPPTSQALCWYCCHSFENVPAFYPVELDIKKNIFYFMGNFCSWNCVKGYAAQLQEQRRPQGTSFLALLAFLTVHRPLYCSSAKTEKHSHACPCIDMFKGITLPPKKEVLRCFGGNTSIEEYREGFLTIDKYEWVLSYFHQNNMIIRELESITSTQKRRAYTFCFLSYPGPKEASIEQLYVLPLTHRTVSSKSAVNISNAPPTSTPTSASTIVPASSSISSVTSTSSNTTRGKSVKGGNRTAPSGRRRVIKGAPAPVSSTGSVAAVEESVKEIPEEVVKIKTIEPMISEEQAFYISSANKYGNLMSSMGIVIERKSSLERSASVG
jgi:hypothetical protein